MRLKFQWPKLYWLGVLGAGTAAFLGVRVLRLSSAHAASTRASFTIQHNQLSEDRQGVQIIRGTETYAVRADGSIAQRRVVLRPGLPPSVTDSVFLLPAGKTHLVSHAIQRISTLSITDWQRAHFARVQSQGGPGDPLCAGTQRNTGSPLKFIRQETVLGIDAVKYEGQSGNHRVIAFFAPQLNCFEVKALDEWVDQQGIVTTRTIVESTSIVIGEPEPSLFLLPVNYKESSPSEMRAGLWNLVAPNRPTPECLRNRNEKDDALYWKNRPR